MAGLGLLIAAGVILPNPAGSVVLPARCSATLSSPDLLTSPFTCPTFTEHRRGQPWVFTWSVSANPTGRTTNVTSLLGAQGVVSGFRPLALVADLLVCLVVASAVTAVVVGSFHRSRRRPRP